jgi:hypothetical protein
VFIFLKILSKTVAQESKELITINRMKNHVALTKDKSHCGYI